MKKSRVDAVLRNATFTETNSDISQTSSKSEKFFERFLEKGSPFDTQKEDDEREDVFETSVRVAVHPVSLFQVTVFSRARALCKC